MSLLSAIPVRNFPSALSKGLSPLSAPRINGSGLLIIGCASLFLALATASECHSITHIPSLIYGLVLWGWWGVVASTLWQIGPKKPSLLQLSMLNMALHSFGLGDPRSAPRAARQSQPLYPRVEDTGPCSHGSDGPGNSESLRA